MGGWGLIEGNAVSLIVRETARLAVEQGLYLHVHSNAQAVGTIFDHEPDLKILWAHAGLSEPPEVVSEMMDKYENLWADISIREYQIAPDGKVAQQIAYGNAVRLFGAGPHRWNHKGIE